MKTIIYALILLMPVAQAADISPVWNLTYTSRVQGIDVDTRSAVAVKVTALRETDLASLTITPTDDGRVRVEFRLNSSNAWLMRTNPLPIQCWAEAPHYKPAMIHLAGTDDLVLACMKADPPDHKWGTADQFAIISDMVAQSDANVLNKILLTDEYLPRFKEAYWDEKAWQIESRYIEWRKDAAIQATEKMSAFGRVLVTYYFGSMENVKMMSGEEQIKAASLKQIEQGKLYVEALGAGHKEYRVESITYADDQTAVAKAAFHMTLAGRGHKLIFKRFIIDEVKVWLPVKNDQTWVS